MRRIRNAFKRQKNVKNNNSSFVFLGLVILFVICLASFLLNKELDEYNNINITFFNHSLNKENSSVKLVIDNEYIFESDSLTEKLKYKINLKEGKYLIRISTVNDNYMITDTIEVKEYPQIYDLSIKYNYHPPLKDYLIYLNEKLNQKKFKEKYSDKQKMTIIENYKNNYESSDRYFSFSFWKEPMLD